MRTGLIFILSLVIIQALPLYADAVPAADSIVVENSGFEEPGVGKISDTFDPIPGWHQDVTTDSGVELKNPAVGAYRGFGRSSDGPIYQVLDETITAGTQYTLTFYAANTYNTGSVTASFFYLPAPADPTRRVVLASQDFGLSGMDDWLWDLSFTFTAEAGRAYVGRHLGIQFSGDSGSGWYGLDEVRVTRQAAQLQAGSPYPAPEAQYVDPLVTLTWSAPADLPAGPLEYKVYISAAGGSGALTQALVTEPRYRTRWM